MKTKAFSRQDTSPLGRWWWTVDRWNFGALCSLMAIGFFLTLAASPSVAQRIRVDDFYFVKRHFIYLLPVLSLLVGVSLLTLKELKRFSLILYAGGILLLIATFFIGVEIKGARRWLSFAGFSLQPSEFIKPALVVMCAWMIVEGKINKEFPGTQVALGLYAFVLFLLGLQPDMGMVVLTSLVFFGQLFLAGLPLIWVFLALGIGGAGLVGAYFLFPHVASRVDRFLSPDSGDKYSDRYQIMQSLEAFMNGGLFGQGPGEGVVKNHLPDAHADFIFAVAGEEFGIFLCLLIVSIFGFIVVRALLRVLHENDLFIVLATSGLAMEFGLQALINIASTLHLIPTKGMTLPFISYGGSSMMALAIGMGMVLGVTRKRGKGEL